MKESFWGILVLFLGLTSIAFIYFFQNLTNTDEHNYYILKETTEAAMLDALDLENYKVYGVVRIDREKFVENFVRRFAENANLARDYKIEIYDVNETPPKVSLKILSVQSSNVTKDIISFDIENRLDAILETPY
jgi:hypothetical protein